MILFPVSGVEIQFWIPIAVAFAISTFTSMGGVTGAFLILPFQVSVLGFTGPAVSATNMVFNVLAIPLGVYNLIREKRMIWPLFSALAMGTIPGTIIGVIIRINFLPDPKLFKIFVGFVLGYMAYRLIMGIIPGGSRNKAQRKTTAGDFIVENAGFTFRRIEFTFNKQDYSIITLPLMIFAFFVGMIGGIYGIGGGSIIAPVLIVRYKIPVYVVAGAALLVTFISSVIGVIAYTVIAPLYSGAEFAISPDWLLGLFFGIGGFLGIYLGSRIQRFVPDIYIKLILALGVTFLSIKYISGLFI
jgi:uncharacterized membrane protein YfcA